MTAAAPTRLWAPPPKRVESAAITRYRRWLEQNKGLRFENYDALWRWSVEELEAFWESIWEFCGVISHHPYQSVLQRRVMPGPRSAMPSSRSGARSGRSGCSRRRWFSNPSRDHRSS